MEKTVTGVHRLGNQETAPKLIVSRHTREGSLKFSTYYGHSRVQHWSELQDHDIVFTTYGTVATEYRRPRRQVLYHMAFFRIVLDEGTNSSRRNYAWLTGRSTHHSDPSHQAL